MAGGLLDGVRDGLDLLAELGDEGGEEVPQLVHLLLHGGAQLLSGGLQLGLQALGLGLQLLAQTVGLGPQQGGDAVQLLTGAAVGLAD